MKYVNCTVQGTITDTPFVLVDGDPTHYAISIVESESRVRFGVDDHATGGFTLYYNGQSVRTPECVLPLNPGANVEGPVMVYVTPTIELFPDSDCFRASNGAHVVVGLASDFRLFQMFLQGEDISPILAQRVDAGAQGFRVFGTCDWLFKLDPRQHPDYYQRLTEFAQLMRDNGLYLQWTAMADAQNLHNFNQQDHWQRTADALAGLDNIVVLELVNEYWQNGVNPQAFARPSGYTGAVSVGSFGDGMAAPAHWGNVLTFHPRRDGKWWYTVPATAQEVRSYPHQALPVWIGEPIGAADHDEPGRRASNPELFEKMAVGIGVYAAGGVFHSVGGLSSSQWTFQEVACALAFFQGLHR